MYTAAFTFLYCLHCLYCLYCSHNHCTFYYISYLYTMHRELPTHLGQVKSHSYLILLYTSPLALFLFCTMPYVCCTICTLCNLSVAISSLCLLVYGWDVKVIYIVFDLSPTPQTAKENTFVSWKEQQVLPGSIWTSGKFIIKIRNLNIFN